MSIDPKLINGVDHSLVEFDTFIQSLPTPTTATAGNFYHIVTALARESMLNYQTLRQAFNDDAQVLMAWSCRNLLELVIFTKYVLLSKANADEFAGHRFIDGLEIAEHLKELELYMHPSLTVSALDPVITRFTAQMAAEGVTRTRYLAVSQWANTVGMASEYKILNKVCSKFVHPTSWAILSSDIGSARFPEAKDVLYGSGAEFFLGVFVAIKEHIKAHGVSHKP